MDNYVQIFCESCKESYLTKKSNTTSSYQKDYLECWRCDGHPTKVVPHEEITDPLLFLKVLDDELEDANYHDLIGVGKEMWEIVHSYIPKEKQIEVVKEICNKLRNI